MRLMRGACLTGSIALVMIIQAGCGTADVPPPAASGTSGAGGSNESGGQGGSSSATTTGGSGIAEGTGGTDAPAGAGGSAGSVGNGNGGSVGALDSGVVSSGDSGAPDGFWDTSNIPAAKNVMMFKFVNRTNGKYQDSQVFWSFKSNNISEVHSISEMPLYDMPANASGRMYFYLGDPNSKYYDFIEFTIGATRFNGNTTRVDAFGLKVAMRMHCADGFDVAVGEDYATFMEDRAVTFQKFIDDVPDEFKPLATVQAPYRIVEPGAVDFKVGGKYAHYYDAYVDQIWAANGLTLPKPGANASGLGAYPDISAAIFRHTGDKAQSFTTAGKLADKTLWANASTFYSAAPANYYARFWHTHGINGKAYGFPYDDVGGYSSYISHDKPQYIVVAIGW